MQTSFQAWLTEIKKISALNGPRWEVMEYFKEYMEDYNTATMPHTKYYNYEKWEMQEYAKKQKKKSDRAKNLQTQLLTDEEALRHERDRERKRKEQEEFRLILSTMDKDKVDAMRRQEELKAQMQMHYKSGNVDEARRLENLLNREDDDRTKL